MTESHETLRRHVLLISPLTFSYHEVICAALRELGHEVTWWDERASSRPLYKLALRAFPKLTKRWSEAHFSAKLAELSATRISDVLVIKGEGLSAAMTRQLRADLRPDSMRLYLWDGVENVRGVSDIADAFDSVATFDPKDAKERHWLYRPLFARDVADQAAAATLPGYDWCFIGTLHSDRHRVIHRLRKRGRSRGDRSFVFGYLHSPMVKVMRMLIDWTLWLAPAGSLSTQSMPHADVLSVVRSSRSVLDVEHPNQRGLTMRTIETLLAGKKLVTTNLHIAQSDLFHPSRVSVISRESPEVLPEFLETPFLPVPAHLRQKYSVKGWATELLDGSSRRRTDTGCDDGRASPAAAPPA